MPPSEAAASLVLFIMLLQLERARPVTLALGRAQQTHNSTTWTGAGAISQQSMER